MTECIILAAGASQRFGDRKMLHDIGEGKPMLLSTIELYQQVFASVNVVVPFDDLEISDLATSAGAAVILSERANEGLSQSLIAGIETCSTASRWLIALGDMPYIRPATLRTLLANTHDIVAPSHNGRRGNPVIFSSMFRHQLRSLVGDEGGRLIIESNPQRLSIVETQDAGVLYDIDVPSDVRR